MKTKMASLFLFSILLLLGGCSNDSDLSKDNDTASSNTKENENTDISSLVNTKWKLVGIMGIEKIFIELEPKECEACYTITFDTDTTASGRSACNDINILNINPINIARTKVYCGDTSDEEKYWTAIISVTSYIVENDELKFFYNDGKNWLLYKLQKQ
jgi:hypothetical protein